MKKIICLAAAVIFILCLTRAVKADELSDLKQGMEVLQKQMQDQAAEIAAMQKKIQELEAEKQARAKAPEEKAPKDIEDKVAALEKKSKEPYEGGLLSLEGDKWQLGGKLQVDFVDTYRQKHVNKPEPHFQLNKFILTPKVYFTDDIFLYGDIEFYRTSMEVKKMYAQFNGLPLDSFLRAGIDYRFIRPSRKTERYPLTGNAFWRDSEAGLGAGGNLDPLYWRLSWGTGYEENQRAVTQEDSLRMLHDNLKTSNYTNFGEIGTGLGFKYDLKKFGKIDTLGFLYVSRLSNADEEYLRTNVTGYHSRNREKFRYGLNADYSISNANLFAEFIGARDGDLERFGWYIQPSYNINFAKIFNKPSWKYFYAVEPLFRYGRLSMYDIAAFPNNSLTWDREEYTFALLLDVFKNIKLKPEFTIDCIDKGAGTEHYGELVVQLDVKF